MALGLQGQLRRVRLFLRDSRHARLSFGRLLGGAHQGVEEPVGDDFRAAEEFDSTAGWYVSTGTISGPPVTALSRTANNHECVTPNSGMSEKLVPTAPTEFPSVLTSEESLSGFRSL